VTTQAAELVPFIGTQTEHMMPPIPPGGNVANESTVVVSISREQAAAQQQRALEAIKAEIGQRHRHEIESHRTTVNAPPQDVDDRFVNRIKKPSDLANLLAERARLISIYGRGGVGKTALACTIMRCSGCLKRSLRSGDGGTDRRRADREEIQNFLEQHILRLQVVADEPLGMGVIKRAEAI